MERMATVRRSRWRASLVIALCGAAARHACGAQNANDLAKASQNPVADLTSFPLQFNYYSAGGLQSQTALILNVQPVMPLDIDQRWLVISRTIVPYVSAPLPVGGRTTGIADIQQQMYLTPRKAGTFVWGIGPVLSVPTATNDFVRTGQWALGPTAVGLVSPGRWVIGLLANNLWRIGGVDNGADINQLTVQPFINFNIPTGWAIATAPLITANWSAPHDQKWTVPIGIGLSKITTIGRQAVSLAAQYYRAVEHPDAAGANQFRFQFTLLYPAARP
jgi:hypothetical protein